MDYKQLFVDYSGAAAHHLHSECSRSTPCVSCARADELMRSPPAIQQAMREHAEMQYKIKAKALSLLASLDANGSDDTLALRTPTGSQVSLF